MPCWTGSAVDIDPSRPTRRNFVTKTRQIVGAGTAVAHHFSISERRNCGWCPGKLAIVHFLPFKIRRCKDFRHYLLTYKVYHLVFFLAFSMGRVWLIFRLALLNSLVKTYYDTF